MASPTRRPAPRALVALAVIVPTILATVLGAVLAAGPADADGVPWPGHPDRRILTRVVRPGDTATGLAVRYHAWTRELIALNHLGRRAVLRIGARVRIPVVVSAARHHAPGAQAAPPHPVDHPGGAVPAASSRRAVASAIAREARRRGVPVALAQAIGWQESGWRQRVRSAAGAVGVMQVLPGTGLWMSLYVGRPLDLRDTHDNVTAGVVLLRVLLGETRSTRRAVAAYYQGLGAVRRDGLYPDTRRYVRSVLAIRDRLTRGLSPS